MSITPQNQQNQPSWKDYIPTPSPNKRRIKELIARRKEQFSPDDELEETDAKVDIALGFAGSAAAALQIFLLLPWYMTDWTDRKTVAVYKSEYFLPAALILGFIGVPGSGLLGFYIGGTLVFVRFLPWLAATQLGLMEGSYAKMLANIDPYGGSDEDIAAAVADDRYVVPYRAAYNSGGDVDHLPTLRKDRSVLALGESRSGKTTALKSLVAQWRIDGNMAVIAHGSKGEYKEFFEGLGIPIAAVIGPNSDTRWNMFNEIPPDATGRRRRDYYRSLAEVLVPVEGKDPYWDQSAQQLLADICMVVDAENENPHHGHLLRVLDDPEQTHDYLVDHGYHNSAQQIYKDDDELRQEWTNFSTKVGTRFRWLFTEAGDFSFREYFQNPTGAVIIETRSDTDSVADTYASMCKFAIKWALEKPPETQMLLDEIDSIGRVPNLGTAASEGNKNDVRLLVGIQSVGQLSTVYGKDLSAVLPNLQQTIGLAPGTDDEDTDVEYLQSVLGERDELTRSKTESQDIGAAAGSWAGALGQIMGGSKSDTISEERRSPIPPAEMKSWTEGEGIVSNMSGWYHIQWGYPDVIPELHERRGAVSIPTESADHDDPADPEPADANWSESSRSSEGQTEWVEVGNTDDGGQRKR